MKKLAIAIGILVLLIVVLSYNVWRANEEPVTAAPTLLDVGRDQLHAQLQKAEAREAEIEKQDWNSIPLLRQVIEAHQRRIDQLSGNTQAGEIVAHDKEAIARIQKRIADLTATAAAHPANPDSSVTASPSGTPRNENHPSPTK